MAIIKQECRLIYLLIVYNNSYIDNHNNKIYLKEWFTQILNFFQAFTHPHVDLFSYMKHKSTFKQNSRCFFP